MSGVSASRPAPEMPISIARLRTLLKPRSGPSWTLMIGMPSRSSRRGAGRHTLNRAGAERHHLHEVGHHLHFDDLAVGALDQRDHLGVLLERQSDVEMIDALAL